MLVLPFEAFDSSASAPVPDIGHSTATSPEYFKHETVARVTDTG